MQLATSYSFAESSKAIVLEIQSYWGVLFVGTCTLKEWAAIRCHFRLKELYLQSLQIIVEQHLEVQVILRWSRANEEETSPYKSCLHQNHGRKDH